MIADAVHELMDRQAKVLADEDYARRFAHELIQGQGVMREIQKTAQTDEEALDRFWRDTEAEVARRRAAGDQGGKGRKRRTTGKGRG